MSLFNLNPFSFTRAQKNEPVSQECFQGEDKAYLNCDNTGSLYTDNKDQVLNEIAVAVERPEFVKHFTALKRSDFY